MTFDLIEDEVGEYLHDNTTPEEEYAIELERMIATSLPNANLKAKPHIESRIKTLKKEWTIVYDIVQGRGTSGSGWDHERNMVIAEDPVWDFYIISQKDVAQFRKRSFSFFNELSDIYVKDRATGQYAQTPADVLDEIEEDVAHGIDDGSACEHVIGLDDVDISATQLQQSVGKKNQNSITSKKRRTNDSSEVDGFENFMDAAILLSEKLENIENSLSHVLGTEVLVHQKNLQDLNNALREVVGLTEDEIDEASYKLTNNPSQLTYFFTLSLSSRL
ncbi:Myb/SANT-like domain - like 3 [Theobroma cacao]|nr:Myb/SANT-like domain - like 3 [Theobroma cacao]